MLPPEEVWAALASHHRAFEEIPEQLHLFCPKVDDDDYEDYDNSEKPGDLISAEEKRTRIKVAVERQQVAYSISLLLGISAAEADHWIRQWKDRVEALFSKCESCVRTWHSLRKPFLTGLTEQFDQDVIDLMEKRLNDFDEERIDRGLAKAEKILKDHGPMSPKKLAMRDLPAILALYEALCCMPYLSQPVHRAQFNYVFEKTQEKAPLKVTGVIPTMTYFLFQDDPFRLRFARAGWAGVSTRSLTRAQWEWSVHDHLAEAMKQVSGPGASPAQVKLFWEGFLLILDALDEDLILQSLRGMEVQPDIYFLALNHLSFFNSPEILLAIMKVLSKLTRTSAKAFWAAYDSMSASAVAEIVLRSPALKGLLAQSLETPMMVKHGNLIIPILVDWVEAMMTSLPISRRPEVCEFFLRQLFDYLRPDPQGTAEGRATCVLAGLSSLSVALEGFLDSNAKVDAGTSLIYINTLLNVVVKYKDVINSSAELRPLDKYNFGLSDAAMSVIQAALALDSKATMVEWNALHNDMSVQQASQRESAQLWESFLEILYSGRIELAKVMLTAILPLRSIETFKPLKGQVLNDPDRMGFNQRYQRTTSAIANVLQRLSDFTRADLQLLCSDTQVQTMHAIAAALIHAEESIQVAGIALIKAITGEERRSDAIIRLLQQHFSPLLGAFSAATVAVTTDQNSNHPWDPMAPLLKYSDFILNGLCDASVGLLRSKSLSAAENAAVKRWWETQWRCLNHAFKRTKDWVRINEKKVMEDFCRDSMELADRLLAQDGLVAAALSRDSKPESYVAAENDAPAAILKVVLSSPQANSGGLVDMIQLRDLYLVQLIVGILRRLLGRLKQFDMKLPALALRTLVRACKKTPAGDYAVKSNMTDQQRAELLKALGEDEDDDDIQLIPMPGQKTAFPSGKLKQTSLAFPRLDGSQVPAARTNRDDVLELTSAREKHRATLDKFTARQASKPKADPFLTSTAASIKESRQKEKAEKAKRDAEIIAKARAIRGLKTLPGEGSGLQGIAGVQGKDHAPAVRNEVLIGSSDEEEDDDDSDDDLPALISKTGQRTGDEVERMRKIALLEKKRGPVKKLKVQRSAKDQRARLIPPMDELHQAILEWDIFHEGNDPPNGIQCASVANDYQNPLEYKSTFLPLLIYEAWRSFVTAKDEATAKPFGIRIQTRLTIDKFLEVTSLMPVTANKDRNLTEGDLVILSKSEDPLNNSDQPHCLARIWKTTFKKESLEVIYRLSRKTNPIHALLNPNSDAYAVKITNMTTIEREYAALESLKYYDLMDEVLKAEVSPVLRFGDERVNSVMTNYDLNQGQAKAILNAKENDGFTLIQGPPGTGKTKTIVAMVGALLTGHIMKADSEAVAIQRPGVGGPGPGNSAPVFKKLLVCAPSNAAVDELVLRLKAGVKTMTGSSHAISVLRLGRSEAISAAVKDVTLDELVKARMGTLGSQSETGNQRDIMHKEAGEIKIKLADLRPRLEVARCGDDRVLANKLQREVDELRRRQAMIGAKIDADKDSGNTYAREAEIKKRQIQQDILDRAQVLCATLSGSGHEMFRNLNVEFDTVIIDEAAQCVELSALIPLKYGCSKCILVGDPKQLPPTVLSQSAARFGYDQSLFVRMQRNHPEDVHLLDQQYRMHPEISLFPSREFYEGKLFDGADMAKLRRKPWHASELLGPYRFFDVKGVQERGRKGQSLVNNEEVKVAMRLYQRFRQDYGGRIDLRGKIGIITPYKAQLFALRQRFMAEYGEAITEEIEFNTTDAFQGRECEIILFSCVRASPTGGIGFMTDIRRMNVGLTRAKSSLWILGDSRALRQGEFWARLIEDAIRRQLYTEGDVLAQLRKSVVVPPARVDASRGTVAAIKGEDHNMEFKVEDGDVKMEDAPPINQPSVAKEAQGIGPAKPNQVQPWESSRLGGSFKRSIGGFDERGEAVPVMPQEMSRPVIRTSAPKVPGDGNGAARKRALEEDDQSGPPPKRVSSGPSRAAPRETTVPNPPKAPRQAKPPSDPSAMEALGLAPPQRAPPPMTANTSTPPPNGKGPMIPRKKATVDPFIKKKPKRP